MDFNILAITITLAAVFLVVCPAAAGEQVTITAPGDGSYYLNDEIIFSGINTESDSIYLFICGPNLDPDGNKLSDTDMKTITGKEATFATAEVEGDNTWIYTLDTGTAGLEAGTYTIYVVTEPKNKADLPGAEYNTASIVIKKPRNAAETEPVAQPTDSAETEKIKIAASGDGSYYINEEIRFSGTNTESDSIYLFICGPNLDPDGDKLNNPGTAAITGDEGSFATAAVDADGTWEYKLDVSTIDIFPGTYTVYAVTEPKNKADLSGAEYNTVSIVIKRPFISAEVSEPDIQAGGELVITGTAEGNPNSVAIWVFGFDYWNGAGSVSMVKVAPEDDGSYTYVLDGEETAKMDGGEYFVVAQHPMYNDEFDVFTEQESDGSIMVSVKDSFGGNPEPGFAVGGSYALRGTDAAEALVETINSPMVDDTYARCTFVVEEKPEETGIFAAIGNFFASLFG